MNSRFDYAIIDAINNAFRAAKASPLVLGATASGVGGPVGGYVGYLPQTRVTYDDIEEAASGIPVSGVSIKDNLNHIRYRLSLVELGVPSGGITTFTGLTDTPDSYVGNVGKAVIVNATEDGLEFGDATGGVAGIDVYDDADTLIVGAATELQFVGATIESIGLRAKITVGSGAGGFITDAPSDGTTYGRKDGAWNPVAAGSSDYVRLHREEAIYTEGGINVVDAWTPLDINTEVSDASNICSLSAGQFTLSAGTYEIKALSSFYNTWGSVLRLYNVTDDVVELKSMSAYAGGSGDQVSLTGRFTIASSKTFELQYLTEAEQSVFGLGVSMGNRMTNFTGNEIYTVIELYRI